MKKKILIAIAVIAVIAVLGITVFMKQNLVFNE